MMKKYQLYFQKINFERPPEENKIKLADFSTIQELKENYLNYFDEENPITNWEIKDFDLAISKVDEVYPFEETILATNPFASAIHELKNVKDSMTTGFEGIIITDEIPPVRLSVIYD